MKAKQARPAVTKVLTGIRGFDEITEGGFAKASERKRRLA